MKLWVIQILGIIVHFMLMISVFDIRRGPEYFQGYWTNCTNQAISKRLVLIVAKGLDAGKHLNNLTSPFLEKIKKTGVWGKAVGNNLMKKNSIKAIASGFEEQLQLFSNIYKSEQKEYDNIFNYAAQIYYVGDKELLKQFKGSEGWVKTLIQSSSRNVSKENKVFDSMLDKTFKKESNAKLQSKSKLIVFIHFPKYLQFEVKKTSNITNGLVDSLDKLLYRTTQVINKIFKDNQTIFMLCSDEVEMASQNNISESLFLMWGHRVNRKGNISVNITDISVIASTILGNPNPLSSTGRWHSGLFDMTPLEESKANACNALHLASVASVVLQQVGNKVLKNIGLSHSSDEEMLEEYEKKLLASLMTSNNSLTISETSDALATLSLHIIQKDIIFIQRVINSMMHLMYVGWSLLLLTKIISLSISRDAALKHEIKMLRRKTELWFFGLHTVLILLGGLCILFVIIQSWPIYYIMYCLPVLIIWGSVFNNIQNWIGFINKLNKRKSILIFLYANIYAIIIEAYFWGLSYNIVLVLQVACASLINIIICYVQNEYIGIKISTIVAATLLVSSIYIPMNNIELSLPILIPSGLVWQIAGILSAFYMWISAEIVDSVVMIASLTHYCTSFIIIIISVFNDQRIASLIFLILFTLGYFIPIFGKAVIPAAEVPLNVDRYRKSNRIQHVSLCTSSLILIFSTTFETLFAFVLFTFSIMWIFIAEPKIKIESMNHKNAHYVIIFTTLVVLIQHALGLFGPPTDVPYIIRDSFPMEEFVIQVLEKIKIYLPVFMVQFVFTILTLSSGGESQLILAALIQHLCGYRLFLGMEEFFKYEQMDRKMLAHCSLQALMMFQFITRQLTQVLLHASILKTSTFFRSVLQGTRNIIRR